MSCRSLLSLAFLALGAASTPATALEFVANGDFEEEVTLDWALGETGAGALIERRTDLDHDDDYELRISLLGSEGSTWLQQRFLIPSTDLDISAQLKTTVAGTGGAWSASGLRLRYLDQQMAILGETVIVDTSYDCPWSSSASFHLIEITNLDWTEYSFNLNDELLNLPAVVPEQIIHLEVALGFETENC